MAMSEMGIEVAMALASVYSWLLITNKNWPLLYSNPNVLNFQQTHPNPYIPLQPQQKVLAYIVYIICFFFFPSIKLY